MSTPSADYQFSFDGWLFGGSGQGVQVLEISGLEDMPTLRTQDDTRGFQDGMFTGTDFLSGRTLTFTLQIMTDTSNTMQTYLNELKSYLMYQQSGTTVLQFQLPGRSVQRVNARVRKRSIKIDTDYSNGKALAMVELFCPDPRVYDDAAQSQTLTLGSLVGRVYNRIYPLVYQTIISCGSSIGSFTNSGNVTMFPTFTLTGPCINPTIVNSTTGASIPIVYTMTSGDTIIIDPDLRSVILNGSPARNIISNNAQWFGLPPGTTTLGVIVPAAAAGTCVVDYRNAYV